jgi:hypothetical protein
MKSTIHVTLLLYLCFFLFEHSHVKAATCVGSPSVESSFYCERWNDTNACSAHQTSFCVWNEGDQGCFQDCSLVDNSEDCSGISNCHWVQIPAWVWLAINIPVWCLVVGICKCCYHKRVNAGDSVLPLTSNSAATASLVSKSSLIVWCWKEISRQMDLHSEAAIAGGNWIKYDPKSRQVLEAAFQNNPMESCHPSSQYIVDFQSMIQTNSMTGFQRKVVRVDLRQAVADHVWCWQESPTQMHKHKYFSIISGCWIKYNESLSLRLETAFQIEGVTDCTLLDDEVVDFETMKMTNISTGRQCDLQIMPRPMIPLEEY